MTHRTLDAASFALGALATLVVVGLVAAPADAARRRNHEDVGYQLFTSPQVDPIALSPNGNTLYVANTTSNTVGVYNVANPASPILVREIEVGLDPVAIAVRPDGDEVWVSNHVSDSVSVIDTDPASDTYRTVVATIQELDGNDATTFDEPTGIAFADDTKAYVALSSINDIAVIDVATRAITKRVHITAQDPRAIRVRGNRLYVTPFEANNQTELSLCPDPGEPQGAPQCTMDQQDLTNFIVQSPNIPGADARIVKDPDAPDRDLYVFSTVDESPIGAPVSGIGTLIYGMVVTSGHEVILTQTDARNDVNGDDGDELADLDNQMFDNELAFVDCSGGGSCSFSNPGDLLDLEPATPSQADALATPYAIALSGNDTTVVATAASSSRVFTVDVGSRTLLDAMELDGAFPADEGPGQQIPRGIALESDGTGAPQTAFVLNTLENTVSVVDVSNPSSISHVAKFSVGSDPIPDAVRRGRIAFNNGFAATNGTFSCGSCHPDGNTDQLLWRIGGECDFCGGGRIHEVRSTMPVRGLRNTLPLHWDGTLGDPFGGPNGQTGNGGNGGTDCTLGDADGDLDCFRDLVNESLAGVMCAQGPPGPSCSNGPSGLPGELTSAERDDMAEFLASVSYPPARARPMDDVITAEALEGFGDFFLDLQGPGTDLGDALTLFGLGNDNVDTCADMDSGCHSFPLGVDHNSVTLGAFDVPTWRGMYDRFLQFSIGPTAAEEVKVFAQSPGTFDIGIGFPIAFPASPIPWDPAAGFEEDETFSVAFIIFNPVYGSGPEDMFQMFEEASTGFSGAVGRQVTLSQTTTTPGPALTATEALLDRLETADERDLINLRGRGQSFGSPVTVSYKAGLDVYQLGTVQVPRSTLVTDAQNGDLMLTLTGFLPLNFNLEDGNEYRQPLLAPNTTGPRLSPFAPCGGANPPCSWQHHNPNSPIVCTSSTEDCPTAPGDNPMTLTGVDVRSDVLLYMDGQPVTGTVSCVGGSFTPYCDSQEVEIELDSIPSPAGLHLLQVQNPKGPLSNELSVCVDDLGLCNG